MLNKNIFIRAFLSFVIGLIIPIFSQGNAICFSVSAQGGAYNLAGLPVPYNFYGYQALQTLESYAVGGEGDFLFVDLWSGAEFRTKVGNFDLSGVYFVTPDQGWVVGEKGTIFRTDDRGRKWHEQKSDVDSNLYSITCTAIWQCWMVGEKGVILKSTDGFTWKSLNSGTNKLLYAVDFLDENSGLAVGEDSVILQTTDGGLSWIKRKIVIDKGECESSRSSERYPISHLYGVKFFNQKKAWVSGLYGIARTTDGGVSWRGTCLDDGPFNGIVTGKDGTVYAVTSNGYNLISKDSGRTWVKQSSK